MKHEELKLGLLVRITEGRNEGWYGEVKGYHPTDPKQTVLVDLGNRGLWYIPLEFMSACNTCDKQDGKVTETKEEYYDIHYQTAHQPIEVMQANMTKEELIGFLKGNIIKYACRCGRKDDTLKEADKIKRYAAWLVDVLQGKTIDPRK